jgi:branched-chain amino acid transport system permease protein
MLGRLLLGVLVVALLVAPLFVNQFANFVLSRMAIYTVVALGLNLLTGYSGQMSLGHGAFFAIGAYGTAIVANRLGLPWPLCILVGGLVAGFAGYLLGWPSLRLSGPYLAIATLALAIAVPQALLKFEGLTGGVQGLKLAQPRPPAGLGLAQDQWLAYICLVTAILMVWVTVNLVRGRVERAFIALRDSEIAAQAVGVSLPRFKTLAFAVSAFYTGLAGGLLAYLLGYIAPDAFTLVVSIEFLTMVVIGGLASVAGSVIGAVLIVILPLVSSNLTDYLAALLNLVGLSAVGATTRGLIWAIYGVILILVMVFLPGGLISLYDKIAGFWAAKREGAVKRSAVPSPEVKGGG